MERQIVIEFNGKKFNINFPNVGQIIAIETMKNSLAGGSGQYSAMAMSGVKSMYFALDIIDTISFFSVMCPRIKNFLSTEEDTTNMDYLHMKPETIKPLVNLYRKKITPWYTQIMQEINSAVDETLKEDDK